MKKKLFALLLTLCMVLTLLPATAFARDAETTQALPPFQITQTAPQVQTKLSGIAVEETAQPVAAGARFTEAEDAAASLRSKLEARTGSITVPVQLPVSEMENTEENLNLLALGVFAMAIDHTGVPTQGDYLLCHIENVVYYVSGTYDSAYYYLDLRYDTSYYTTAAQEQAVTDRLNSLISSFGFTAATDIYTKVSTVYDYIRDHVTYDNANLNNASYTLKYSAYAALINGKAVCQGYASLLYRMLLMIGVDNRVIVGTSKNQPHAWNIIKMDSRYYNADVTWDSQHHTHYWFLMPPILFGDHDRAEAYNTAEFRNAYPMANEQYTPSLESGKCGDNAYWNFASDGTLSITGSGAMYDYGDSSTSVPWMSRKLSITRIVIGDGITSIGDAAFDCPFAQEVVVGKNVTSVGSDAFLYSKNLRAIYIRDLAKWTAITYENEGSYPQTASTLAKTYYLMDNPSKNLVIPSGVSAISSKAFAYATIRSVTLPESVTSIGADAFYNSTVQTITFNGNAPTFADTAFNGITATAFYPCNNESWTENVLQSYGGAVTWNVGHTYRKGICTRCSAPDPDYVPFELSGVTRLAGRNRFETAFMSADALKEVQGVEKFPAAIVTSGMNFADALAGSYLAAVTGAPILLTDNDNMADVIAYIEANVEAGGTVYALGGSAVVSDTLMAVESSGYQFKRLAGSNRFATNLMILEEAGINSGDPVLVCTAYNFADSLSASALGLPILLVDDTVSAAQMDFLRENADGEFILVGGTGAVTPAVEEQLREYWDVVRLAGNNRFQTSVLTAIDAFGYSADAAVLAYGYNFPDGLCAGPLAYALGAPLILTATGDEAAAAEYATAAGITSGFVLGGPTLIDDAVADSIFSIR